MRAVPKTAFLFPGEGMQAVGMGKGFMLAHPACADLYELAQACTGVNVYELCSNGPAAELDLLQNCQPCLVTTGVVIARALQEVGVEPDCVAGYGCGEYAAHVVANTLDDETALQLVGRRGALSALAARGADDPLSILHSERAQQVAVGMQPAFKGTAFAPPQVPLYCNLTAAPLEVTEVDRMLGEQLTHPVLWEETLRALLDAGVERVIECGSFGALASLNEQVVRQAGAGAELVRVIVPEHLARFA